MVYEPLQLLWMSFKNEKQAKMSPPCAVRFQKCDTHQLRIWKKNQLYSLQPYKFLFLYFNIRKETFAIYKKSIFLLERGFEECPVIFDVFTSQPLCAVHAPYSDVLNIYRLIRFKALQKTKILSTGKVFFNNFLT